jgi:hypothetical protein
MDQQTQETTAADDNAPDKIGPPFHLDLSCKITADEHKEREVRLRKLLDLIDAEEASLEDQKAKSKSKVKGYEAELERIRLELNSGLIDKPVKCEERFYYRVGLVEIVRTDTGAVKDTRAMTPAERNPELPFPANGHRAAPVNEDVDDEGDEDESGEGGGDEEPPPELDTAKGSGVARRRKSKG